MCIRDSAVTMFHGATVKSKHFVKRVIWMTTVSVMLTGINLKEVAETLVVNNSIELKLSDVKIGEDWYEVGDHIEIDDREVEITYELFYDLEVIAGLHNDDIPNPFDESDYTINFSELHAVIELKEKAKAKAVKAEFVKSEPAWYEQTR